MLSTELKSKINKLWDKFWSRGITNPINAIEQISYLLFLRRLEAIDKEEEERSKVAESNIKQSSSGRKKTKKGIYCLISLEIKYTKKRVYSLNCVNV